MNFDEFLFWASNAGVWAVVGWLLPWLTNLFGAPWEDIVPPRWRRPTMLLLCQVVPVTAALLRYAMKYVPISFPDLIWPAMVAGFVAFGEYGMVMGAKKLPSTKAWRSFKARHTAAEISLDAADGKDFDRELSREIQIYSWTG